MLNQETKAMETSVKLFRVTLDGHLTGDSDAVDDAAHAALIVAVEELHKLGAGNAAVDLTSSTGEIRISCAVEAVARWSALETASDNIRLALHTGEIGTPDWPETHERSWRVEFIQTKTEELVTT